MSNEERVTAQPGTEDYFLQFISGMAAQALVHLGLTANPMTGKVTVDLPNAKYSIDLLAVLEAKTEGNRTEEESKYLQTALCDLRLHYVRVASEDGKEDAAESDHVTDAEDDSKEC